MNLVRIKEPLESDICVKISVKHNINVNLVCIKEPLESDICVKISVKHNING